MKFKIWTAEVLDCKHDTVVHLGSSSEAKARKKFAEIRFRGFECSACSQDEGEPVRHYDLRMVKK